MSDSKTTYSRVSTLGLLGVAFVVLKLTNVINWSWWWVTLPFWAPLGIVLIGLVAWLIIVSITVIFSK